MKRLFMALFNILLSGLCEGITSSFPMNVRHVDSAVRIIGGEVVEPHIYPFVVAILLKNNNRTSFCGGTLLTPAFVLTAAHCLDSKPERVGVILGRHNVSVHSGEIISAQKIIVHEGWNKSSILNDIALIKLNRNATLNANVTLVKLSTSNSLHIGEMGTILGWGRDERYKQSHVLKSVESEIITNGVCAQVYKVFPCHLCTSGSGVKGSCQGDSGGPLLVSGIQVGIVSFGAINCTAGYPSVFTRVADYHQWIEDNIKGAGCARGISVAVTILVTAVSLSRFIMLI